MPQERLPKQALLAKANGKNQLDDIELDGPITFENLVWNRLGLHPSEMTEVMEDRKM